MNIIWQLVVGLFVGVIARFLLPGREAFPPGIFGWVLTALLGVGGAFIGGWLGRTFLPWANQNYAAGWIMSILGAVILLLVVRLIFGKGSNAV
jgi:uncharacterized membrane protein YeaQ/YmgE (transglycosylase-associated protein family)